MRKYLVIFMLLVAVIVLLLLMDIATGSVRIPFSQLLDALFGTSTTPESIIVHEFRLPKAFTALFAGLGLSVSGLLLQTLFRNPLADPFVLGVSSGASLGVSMILLSGSLLPFAVYSMLNSSIGITLAAALGAGFVLVLIWVASLRIGNQFTVLIFGMMLGQIFAALQGSLNYFSKAESLKDFVVWGMGSYSNVTGLNLWVMGTVCLVFAGLAFLRFRQYNLYLLGNDYARSMGLDVARLRTVTILITGILAGSITAFCGPVAFLGMSVPHLARFLFRTSDHKILIPGVCACGATLSLACDILTQLPFSDKTLPINVITSLVGGPVVIWVIFSHRRFSENR